MPWWMEHIGLQDDGSEVLVNGQVRPNAPGLIPWQASIRAPGNGPIGPHFCGGTILDEKTVLSAAHCFCIDGNSTWKLEDFAGYKVMVGAKSLDIDDGDETAQVI